MKSSACTLNATVSWLAQIDSIKGLLLSLDTITSLAKPALRPYAPQMNVLACLALFINITIAVLNDALVHSYAISGVSVLLDGEASVFTLFLFRFRPSVIRRF